MKLKIIFDLPCPLTVHTDRLVFQKSVDYTGVAPITMNGREFRQEFDVLSGETVGVIRERVGYHMLEGPAAPRLRNAMKQLDGWEEVVP